MAILRVDQSASGNNDGTTWTDAYQTLNTCLTNAANDDEIWLKADTYNPHATDRDISFNVSNRLSIYGGFDGTETSRGQRDTSANVAILDGDINTSSDNSDNSYHVVCVCGDTIPDGSLIIFDGFDIRNGNSNGPKADGNHRGPGICYNNFNGKLKLVDVDMTNNIGPGPGLQGSVSRYG